MMEAGNQKSVKFSEDLKTPMELPPVESWPKDNCKFMERGKVLTQISNEICCFQFCRSTTWHLCYVIRTSDDALIIFTAPEKGFVLNLSSAIYLKIARNETSRGKRICKVNLKWKFGKVKLKFAENQILIWRQRFLSTFGRMGDPNRNATAVILKNQNDDTTCTKKTELDEEWDTTDSVTSLTGSYTLCSHSSKSESTASLENTEPLSSDSVKANALIRLAPNIKTNQSPSDDAREKVESKSHMATFRKKKFCKCRRLLGLISRRDDSQQRDKTKSQKTTKQSKLANKNKPRGLTESHDLAQQSENIEDVTITPTAGSTALLHEPSLNSSGKISAMTNSSRSLALPEPSESSA